MLNNIKETLKHTAIYSIGSFATKLIGIVLLPLYTAHISVTEYGILGVLEITFLIAAQVLIFGQSTSLMSYYHRKGYENKRKIVFFSIFVMLVLSTFSVTMIFFSFSGPLSSFFETPSLFKLYFQISSGIIFFRVINNLLLNDLRVREKSVIYAASNITQLTVILALNIYFVAYLKIGISGILYAYLIGEILLTLILLFPSISNMKFKIDLSIWKESFYFGLPLIFSSLASMLLSMGDRYLLKLLVNYEEVGLYNLGYKIAGILNVFLIQSFMLGIMPLAFKKYGKQGDLRYYSKIMTYFIFILTWAGLGLAFFNEDLIKFFANDSSYWPAAKVVPIIILAYIFSGASSVASISIILKRKTGYHATNYLIAFIANVGINLYLIPKYRMMGAAYATLISYIILFICSYYFSNRLYKIPFENLKLLKILSVGIIFYILTTLYSPISGVINYSFKLSLVLLFPFALFLLNFYEQIELDRLKSISIKVFRLIPGIKKYF
ncbi:MAG: polysaccharide biosynthesis C-terminal domain-containing protein [Calditrichaceae bacterium]